LNDPNFKAYKLLDLLNLVEHKAYIFTISFDFGLFRETWGRCVGNLITRTPKMIKEGSTQTTTTNPKF
jgi:hypothetical protein